MTNSSFGNHAIYNSSGQKDYEIDKKWTLIADKYEIKVVNKESEIPITFVILLTCIEDAIGDAH